MVGCVIGTALAVEFFDRQTELEVDQGILLANGSADHVVLEPVQAVVLSPADVVDDLQESDLVVCELFHLPEAVGLFSSGGGGERTNGVSEALFGIRYERSKGMNFVRSSFSYE